jgi:hypothetical protein
MVPFLWMRNELWCICGVVVLMYFRRNVFLSAASGPLWWHAVCKISNHELGKLPAPWLSWYILLRSKIRGVRSTEYYKICYVNVDGKIGHSEARLCEVVLHLLLAVFIGHSEARLCEVMLHLLLAVFMCLSTQWRLLKYLAYNLRSYVGKQMRVALTEHVFPKTY